MPITEQIASPPDRLADNLIELSHMRWQDVTAAAIDSSAASDAYFEGLGWTIVAVDPRLAVALPSSDVFEFDPANAVATHVGWYGAASVPAENRALLSRAAELFPGYLNSTARVLGSPVALAAWDDPDFPPVYPWISAEYRLTDRCPYRVAAWTTPWADFVLWVNVGPGTTSGEQLGRASIELAVLTSETAVRRA